MKDHHQFTELGELASRDVTSADLCSMQEVAIQCWTFDRPVAHMHVGDLAWQTRQHTGREGEGRRRIWTLDGRPVAWGWLVAPDEGELQVVPARRRELVAEVADWLSGQAAEQGAAALTVSAADTDGATLGVLCRSGFTAQPGLRYDHNLLRLDGPLPDAAPPPGFTARHMQGDTDVERRVAVHRAAFSIDRPSRVTVESYRAVMAEWPYRPQLDWVVEAPDGRFAAACLTWLDEGNRAGLLEPVGTDPAFWRQGCARAACAAALAALQRCGARTAVVGSIDAPGRPPARALYRSLGFETVAQTIALRRPV